MFKEVRGLTLPSLVLLICARENYIMIRKWCHYGFLVSNIKRNPNAAQMQRVGADPLYVAAVSKLLRYPQAFCLPPSDHFVQKERLLPILWRKRTAPKQKK